MLKGSRCDSAEFALRPVDRSWTVLVDRDGVINRRIVGSYVRSVDEFEILPGALTALARLSRMVGRVVVVTNQAGVGKKLVTAADLDLIHASLTEAVALSGGRLDAILYCPHVPDDHCRCRKPRTGLADQAARLFPETALSHRLMIGDSISDLQFADRLAIASILIRDGDNACDPAQASAVAKDLHEAVQILEHCAP